MTRTAWQGGSSDLPSGSMRIQVVSRHQDLQPSLREHIERRFSSLSQHYDSASCYLHVELDQLQGGARHPLYEVHARLSVPGRMLVAHGREFDAYAAADAAEKMMRREIDRWRERRIDSRTNSLF